MVHPAPPGPTTHKAGTVVDWLETRSSWPGLYAPEPSGRQETLLSRNGLLVRAAAAAHELRLVGLMPGDRVMTLLPTNAALPVVVFGTWLAGGVLVPAGWASPGGFRDSLLQGLKLVYESTRPRVVVGTPVTLAALKEAGLRVDDAAVLTDAEIWKRTALPAGNPDARPAPEDPALVQLGLAGLPDGRLLRHGELLARLQAVSSPTGDLVEALLLPLLLGIPTHLIPMQSFVGSPRGWASSLSRLGNRTQVSLLGEESEAGYHEPPCPSDRWGLASAPSFGGFCYASIVFHRGGSADAGAR